jgi:hypothetical protein
LSPNGAGHHQAPRQRSAGIEAAPEPRVSADDRAGGAAAEAAKASRLDFLFRSKSPRPAPQPENFEPFWPGDARPGGSAPAEPAPQPRYEQIERRPDFAAPAQERAQDRGQDRAQDRAQERAQDRPQGRRSEPAPAPASESHGAAILKSGVVDGMAYTLYADGSIEAKLPHGTVRFGSIAELRAHIENSS